MSFKNTYQEVTDELAKIERYYAITPRVDTRYVDKDYALATLLLRLRDINANVQFSPTKPKSAFITLGNSLKKIGSAPLPFEDTRVPFITYDGSKYVYTNSAVTKKNMLRTQGLNSEIIVPWPGQYSTDVFVIDDAEAALKALGNKAELRPNPYRGGVKPW